MGLTYLLYLISILNLQLQGAPISSSSFIQLCSIALRYLCTTLYLAKPQCNYYTSIHYPSSNEDRYSFVIFSCRVSRSYYVLDRIGSIAFLPSNATATTTITTLIIKSCLSHQLLSPPYRPASRTHTPFFSASMHIHSCPHHCRLKASTSVPAREAKCVQYQCLSCSRWKSSGLL